MEWWQAFALIALSPVVLWVAFRVIFGAYFKARAAHIKEILREQSSKANSSSDI